MGGMLFLNTWLFLAAPKFVLSQIVPVTPANVVATPPGSVTVNSFESVELEKLRMSKEASKVEKEEAEFKEGVIKLQKKLIDASADAITPENLPSDYNSFINAPSRNIQQSQLYYNTLKQVLNNLTPTSPYLSRTQGDSVNVIEAGNVLSQLGNYEEDEGVSRTILNQWSAKEGGARDDANRIMLINRSISELEKERERLQWNYNQGQKINPLSGEPINTDKQQASLLEQTGRVKDQISELVKEKSSFNNFANTPLRKLEFQQFIVQLAAQQRYIHALIACGFYRNVFQGGDMSLSEKAYPKSTSSGSSPTDPNQQNPTSSSVSNGAAPSSAGTTATSTLPMISTITGLESFLLNRIRDAKNDRDSLDNMIKSKQLSAAESLVRKMISTAKYQPELQTLPYEQRQIIANYTKTIRRIFEALNSKNWPEVENLSRSLEEKTSDVGTQDLRAFSKENRDKSILWTKMAEVAMRGGDIQTAEALIEAAHKRAPIDESVSDAISSTQNKTLNNQAVKEQLKQILKNNNYSEAFQRIGEFIPVITIDNDPVEKKDFERIINEEKSVQIALDKSTAMKQAGASADAWMALEMLQEPLNHDKRVIEQKSLLESECQSFIASYYKAKEDESSDKLNQAICWYLQALSNAPNTSLLKDKIKELASKELEIKP
jgi:tetratricopeptide (TPR) repeat protein